MKCSLINFTFITIALFYMSAFSESKFQITGFRGGIILGYSLLKECSDYAAGATALDAGQSEYTKGKFPWGFSIEVTSSIEDMNNILLGFQRVSTSGSKFDVGEVGTIGVDEFTSYNIYCSYIFGNVMNIDKCEKPNFYLGGGVGYTWYMLDLFISGEYSEISQFLLEEKDEEDIVEKNKVADTFSYHFLVGVEYLLRNNLEIYVEGRYHRTNRFAGVLGVGYCFGS